MSGGLPVYAAFFTAAGPYLFYRGFRDFRLKRLMEDTPSANIRSMAMGLVEVSGHASARSDLIAPFSGNACAYWEVDISVPTKYEDDTWATVHQARSHQPFYLDDNTGVALVYPDGAECKVPFASCEIMPGTSLPEPYASYVKEHPSIDLSVARLGSIQFRERLIHPKEQVFVLGSAFPRPNSVNVSDDAVLGATGTDDAFAAQRHAMDERLVGVIRKGQNDPHFIISLESALMLETGLGRWVLELVAGPVMTLVGLAYWLSAIRVGYLW